ncbi:MAG: hypothetical protein A2268_04955 [Candidatus Raymondbacteria bacterium RifOxyA12_full_50_37]|uniref:Uncharacterized protein n=1 Tax=Candidatus Raymondbacteria bacterium RIFOXYD12_FULL_49_13 TaxID=1817890 RepID=A0A1F7FDC1_UNCRA|nr:MAG: hypothetical protein A2268_04955 [Candidatus Raymondbacteria bacterium RifOxyA12_full_50_37]OGJ94092.1 MAG: hypothetical protein A2248_12160 [Candidatus Raymondbacteria bacterium RIFOXYA2_FULL_49_16]OGJ96917.1 MAG: hypothetical protein A2453_04760 [Candidatus Raymondbacteria bacterium RIFOXYC2_FULL_50_21]OGK03019.1 MAG: hypothetical protein A2350_03625 [Candidatus Raymondbacteria bacterium RifOxyB12_full_50_8]OGK04643.1 MAG: hypothetical protein A2519_20925 [Candidatus Raymondbacteria b
MRKIRNIKGQGMTEYIIIVAIVAIAAVAAFKMFGHRIRTSLFKTGTQLETEVTGEDGINNTDDGSE